MNIKKLFFFATLSELRAPRFLVHSAVFNPQLVIPKLVSFQKDQKINKSINNANFDFYLVSGLCYLMGFYFFEKYLSTIKEDIATIFLDPYNFKALLSYENFKFLYINQVELLNKPNLRVTQKTDVYTTQEVVSDSVTFTVRLEGSEELFTILGDNMTFTVETYDDGMSPGVLYIQSVNVDSKSMSAANVCVDSDDFTIGQIISMKKVLIYSYLIRIM
ncbi:hypothetical protein [Alphaproteobacteria bacterium endosymbiont of Tiliacea citrago]|uniref:hypothetical protein n=1 Tax=Alphaproteobacteria bacterium endosymbiont of Tiliacea citrago TaxID=3077944 RepID=UPI00313CE606